MIICSACLVESRLSLSSAEDRSDSAFSLRGSEGKLLAGIVSTVEEQNGTAVSRVSVCISRGLMVLAPATCESAVGLR